MNADVLGQRDRVTIAQYQLKMSSQSKVSLFDSVLDAITG